MGRKIANALGTGALVGIMLLIGAYRLTYGDHIIFGPSDEATRSEISHATAWYAAIAVLFIVVGLSAMIWLALHPNPSAPRKPRQRARRPTQKTQDSQWSDWWD